MLLAIEGVTGIGKSTLQKALTEHYHSQSLIIDFTKNPYLHLPNQIGKEPVDYALEREMIFMLMGYHQLKSSGFDKALVVSDFAFDRFEVFASTVLSQSEMRDLFVPASQYLQRTLPVPRLIIRLTASPEFVLERIRKRNRDQEEYFNLEYLSAVETAFQGRQQYHSDDLIELSAEAYNLHSSNQDILMIVRKLEDLVPELRGFRRHA